MKVAEQGELDARVAQDLGFEGLEGVGATASSMVYRARRVGTGERVLLKLPNARSRREAVGLNRFRAECELLQSLKRAEVPRVLTWRADPPGPVLVLRDCDGESLEGMLGAALPLAVAIQLGEQLAGALATLHRAGLVHHDFRPANVLASADGSRVLLIDLSRAAPCAAPPASESLPREALAYVSPEETGRLRHTVDLRADLYSLGVVLFRAFAGAVPFETGDPLALVHAHLARSPVALDQAAPGVPRVVAEIVTKLLAKAPADRYQSARGVQHDLRRCRELLEATGGVQPFRLAAHDAFERVQTPSRLHGREQELKLLLGSYERVVGGGALELVMVSGYSGIGKSSLIRQLEELVLRDGGFFVSGKFDQARSDIPYASLTTAFQALIKQVLSGPEQRVESARRRVQASLGGSAGVLSALVPGLELLVGQPPPVEELGLVEAELRLQALFRAFVEALPSKDSPLVLFLDDLQWLDPGSRKLLQSLLERNQTPHLLVIGAFRDNEVSESHSLLSMLAALRSAGAKIVEVPLSPLTSGNLAGLIADALHSSKEDVAALAELIYQKAAGNPFFSIQFLLSAEDEGLLEFDGRREAFDWDVAKIRSKNFSDNVVELMIRKLRRLAGPAQEALWALACLGNSADVETLGLVLGKSESDLDATLWEPIAAGLLVRSDGFYRFLHDRVQEAAYALIAQPEVARAHLEIGRALLSKLSPEAVSERVFELVNQYNRALELISDAAERDAVAELNFRAALRAKAQAAWAAARTYLLHCSALLPPDTWNTRYQYLFAVHLELAECEFLVGAFERADRTLDRLLEMSRSPVDRAAACRLRIRVYQVAGRPGDAVTVLLEALAPFGFVVPTSDSEIQAATQAELRFVLDSLRGRAVEDLVDAPVATDPDARAIVRLLDDGFAPVYVSRPELWALLVIKSASTSLRYGNVDEGSAFAYLGVAVILSAVVGDPSLGLALSEMSLRLNERFETTRARLRGKLLFHHAAMVNCWSRHFSTSLAGMETAFPACLEVGDLVYAGYLTFNATFCLFETGASLERVAQAAGKYAAFAARSKNDIVYRVLRAQEQFVKALQGTTSSPTSFNDADFDEVEHIAVLTEAKFGVGLAFFHITKQIAAFIARDWALALESARRAEGVLREVVGQPVQAAHHFYLGLTVAAAHDGASADQQREHRATLAAELARHRAWAEGCSENFGNRHALLAAELARIEGRLVDAEQGYDEAIQSAKKNGFIHQEALAWEHAMRFYRARGRDGLAEACQQRARDCYLRWGVTGELRLRAPAPSDTPLARGDTLDLVSVIKVSQAISREMELDVLVDTLMRALLESAGAQRAVLLLPRGDELGVVAVARIDAQGVHIQRRAYEAPAAAELPLSILGFVRRSRGSLLLEDARRPSAFSRDEYLAQAGSKSVLCLPLLRQAKLVGALYLENELISDAFHQDRLALLELLAAQAAISLENARLYGELKRENAEREQAETALMRSQGLLKSLIDASSALIHVKDLDGRYLLVNRRAAAVILDGASESVSALTEESALLGMSDYDFFAAEQADAYRQSDLRVIASRATLETQDTVPQADGIHTYLTLKAPLIDADGKIYGTCGISTDITERKRAEEALSRTQEQLRQAQKMEAIGNLAGGIAHDFNNLLMVILGYGCFLRAGIDVDDPRQEHVSEIDAAAQRAAELTGQLLAFSRKQLLQPRVLNLNDVIVGAEKLLRRLIGEDVELTVRLAPDLGNVNVDPGQVEQIVMNLAVNARDAMPRGGKLTIETANVDLDEGYAAAHLGASVGPHVVLAVSDAGVGIDKETQSRMFEPFFTTKEAGKGTGLGLAMVLGIVQQSGGNICVESELGKGTTFKVHLPRTDAATTRAQGPADTSSRPPVGTETILLVEDEQPVRVLMRNLLQQAGYTVLEAQSSGDALVISEQHAGPIHLLLTDVIMPRMSGREVSERLHQQRPTMKVLFMSGYTDDAIVRHGVLVAEMAFLQKPVTPPTLIRKIREVLDTPS